MYWLAEGADARHVNAAREVYDGRHGQIPSLFVAVKALPKGALVEKQIVVHTGRCAIRDEEDDEITMESRKATFESGKLCATCAVLLTIDSCLSGKSGNTGNELYWELSSFAENTSRCAIVWATSSKAVNHLN